MFEDMWNDLAVTLEEFLFSDSCPPPNQSLEEQQNDEVLDTRVSGAGERWPTQVLVSNALHLLGSKARNSHVQFEEMSDCSLAVVLRAHENRIDDFSGVNRLHLRRR